MHVVAKEPCSTPTEREKQFLINYEKINICIVFWKKQKNQNEPVQSIEERTFPSSDVLQLIGSPF